MEKIVSERPKIDWTPKTAEMMEEMIDGPSCPKEGRHLDYNGGAGTSSHECQGEMPSTQGIDGLMQDSPVDMPVNDSVMKSRSSRRTQEVYILWNPR